MSIVKIKDIEEKVALEGHEHEEYLLQANLDDVVKLKGDQTITGDKTFKGSVNVGYGKLTENGNPIYGIRSSTTNISSGTVSNITLSDIDILKFYFNGEKECIFKSVKLDDLYITRNKNLCEWTILISRPTESQLRFSVNLENLSNVKTDNPIIYADEGGTIELKIRYLDDMFLIKSTAYNPNN